MVFEVRALEQDNQECRVSFRLQQLPTEPALVDNSWVYGMESGTPVYGREFAWSCSYEGLFVPESEEVPGREAKLKGKFASYLF